MANTKKPKRTAKYIVTAYCKPLGGQPKLKSKFIFARSEKEAISRFNFRVKVQDFGLSPEAKVEVTQPSVKFLYYCDN